MGNSQVSVYRTIGPTLVFFCVRMQTNLALLKLSLTAFSANSAYLFIYFFIFFSFIFFLLFNVLLLFYLRLS